MMVLDEKLGVIHSDYNSPYWGPLMFVQNSTAIVTRYFNKKTKMSSSWWCYRKSQGHKSQQIILWGP